jgi:MFS family permease
MWNLLRTNHDIRSLFVAQVVSFMGDWFAYVAFVGLVQDVTDAPILVTLVYVAQALPAFVMAVIAGPVADRFDRRNIIRIVSMVQAVAAAGLLLVGSAGSLWFGFLCLCVISALGSFVGPSAQAGLPNLARSPEEHAKAALLFGSLWGAMLAIGAALRGRGRQRVRQRRRVHRQCAVVRGSGRCSHADPSSDAERACCLGRSCAADAAHRGHA